jgi:hypothetical protein
MMRMSSCSQLREDLFRLPVQSRALISPVSAQVVYYVSEILLPNRELSQGAAFIQGVRDHGLGVPPGLTFLIWTRPSNGMAFSGGAQALQRLSSTTLQGQTTGLWPG